MKRTDIKVVPDYFQKYIDRVEDVDLLEVLPEGGIELFSDNLDQCMALGLNTYAEGKWTINQMIEHLMDTERIFLNRSLRFARKDQTDLPGYDENHYANAARSNEIPLADLLQQYRNLRQATFDAFSNFNDEELLRTGTANGQEISVLAMGFILIGHPIHHFRVLEERYFPLFV